MKYTITGMTCDACKKLIEMELEDSGFMNCSVSLEEHALEVPREYQDRMDEVSKIVSSSGDYTLEVNR